ISFYITCDDSLTMLVETIKIKLYNYICCYTISYFYSLNMVHADNMQSYNFIAIGGEIVDNPLIISILLAFILIVGIVVGYLIRKSIAEAKISSAENLAKQIVDQAH